VLAAQSDCARELGRQAAPGLGPRESRAREVSGPRPRQAETGRNPDEMNFSSLFLFPIFQSKFSKDFQIKFEFDLNHSIQNFKCSSMNAQSCFYTYI
jgi:hypothetical protein